MTNFRELLSLAKSGSHQAIEEILLTYRPLLLKESITDGVLNEDLYQEQCITLLRCIQVFRI